MLKEWSKTKRKGSESKMNASLKIKALLITSEHYHQEYRVSQK